MTNEEKLIREFCRRAGIEINGSDRWDPRVHSPEVYTRIFGQGSLGLGESYMEGLWDCAALDEFFSRLFTAYADQRLGGDFPLRVRIILAVFAHNLFNFQQGRERQVGEFHYDTGNDFFAAMLDPSLTYSCGYWKEAKTLQEAQSTKHELICRKLGLTRGMRILDVGCGWGSFLRHAVEHYGVQGVGITISREQMEFGQKALEGLPITIQLQSYHQLEGEQFDRIVSVGMLEHVGHKNYPLFMRMMRELLAKDGLFLLHTIGSREKVWSPDPWIAKYIFPNSELPSRRLLEKSIDREFYVVDWHEFGAYYDPTLMAWHANLERHKASLSSRYQEERFWRMWRYFLLMSAGLFRARRKEVWQLVLSKSSIEDYSVVR